MLVLSKSELVQSELLIYFIFTDYYTERKVLFELNIPFLNLRQIFISLAKVSD